MIWSIVIAFVALGVVGVISGISWFKDKNKTVDFMLSYVPVSGTPFRWALAEKTSAETIQTCFSNAMRALVAVGYDQSAVEKMLCAYGIEVKASESWKNYGVKVAGVCDIDNGVIRLNRTLAALVHEIGHVIVFEERMTFDYNHVYFDRINQAAKIYAALQEPLEFR